MIGDGECISALHKGVDLRLVEGLPKVVSRTDREHAIPFAWPTDSPELPADTEALNQPNFRAHAHLLKMGTVRPASPTNENVTFGAVLMVSILRRHRHRNQKQ